MGARFSVSLLGILALAVLIGILAARSQSPTVAAPAPTVTPTSIPIPAPGVVEIVTDPRGKDPALYYPIRIDTRVGQPVTWVNMDPAAHTVVADNGAFDSKALTAGEKFTWTPKKPGVYIYGCFFHPEMRGVVLVAP